MTPCGVSRPQEVKLWIYEWRRILTNGRKEVFEPLRELWAGNVDGEGKAF